MGGGATVVDGDVDVDVVVAGSVVVVVVVVMVVVVVVGGGAVVVVVVGAAVVLVVVGGTVVVVVGAVVVLVEADPDSIVCPPQPARSVKAAVVTATTIRGDWWRCLAKEDSRFEQKYAMALSFPFTQIELPAAAPLEGGWL